MDIASMPPRANRGLARPWPPVAALPLVFPLFLAPALPAAAEAGGGRSAEGPAECRPAAAASDAIAGLDARGEIRLASGARALLGSVGWPEDAAAAQAARDWLAARTGRALVLVARGGADRWGRLRIDAVVEDEGIDLAGGLVAAGLAAVDAGEGDSLCRPALLYIEAGARRQGLGLWSRPAPAAEAGPALRAEAGRFVLAEGRVRHVGVRAARTYLDFVARGGDGLTVTVSKHTWRRMLERGLSAAGLTGRRVRVRGIVEIRRGPVIEVSAPELVEVLEDGGRADAPADRSDGGRAQRR